MGLDAAPRHHPPRDKALSSRRLSMAFFHQPNYDAVIECLPTCVTAERPARYGRTTSGEHVWMKITKHARRTWRRRRRNVLIEQISYTCCIPARRRRSSPPMNRKGRVRPVMPSCRPIPPGGASRKSQRATQSCSSNDRPRRRL